ncbi:MAG: hypothetical protein Q7R95_07980 [bacterium]|nr:hypothetical protein [bacterium]
MENKYILESLSSDLKRVAIGLYRGSNTMANRFLIEALKRKKELNQEKLAPYIQKILNNINTNIDSEKALMYSTLLQNYTINKTF